MKRVVLVVCVIAVLALTLAGVAGAADPTQLNLPEKFSYIGSPVHSYTTTSGHVVHYIDQGKKDWRVAVLIGGAGTGVQAYELTQFARDLQLKLHLRVICVERNGFGLTKFEPADAAGALMRTAPNDAALALADPVKTRELYAANVVEVLDHLDVNQFSVIAISGGGPFSASSPAWPALACAPSISPWRCTSPRPEPATRTPVPGDDEELHHRPHVVVGHDRHHGRQDPRLAGARLRRGRVVLLRARPGRRPARGRHGLHDLPEGGAGRIHGDGARLHLLRPQDTTVPPAQRDAWVAAYSASAKITQRNYADGVHDVQYRHWDQILLDVAGYGKYLVVAYKGQTRVVPQGEWTWYEKHGAILGMQAWKTAKAPVD